MLTVPYDEFLASKRLIAHNTGFNVALDDLNPLLFPFQKAVTRWALAKGRAAIFARYGLGKTLMQLEWAHNILPYIDRPVLIFAPLGVNAQTAREGAKFGIPVNVCRTGEDVQPGINIVNYEMMQHFHAADFGAVVLDESSILKAMQGKTKKALIEFAANIPYRLCCTATPAPNDWDELLNHAEFLGVRTRKEILAEFFTHDGNDTSKWKLKDHAVQDFWAFVASWAIAFRKPSDIGFSDDGYNLPPLNVEQITVEGKALSGMMFATEALTLQERQKARRESLPDRVKATAELVNASDEQWLVWCDLNDESAALTKAIGGAVEVAGRHSPEHKTQTIIDFLDGKIRVIVSKPTIYGFGLNLQNCHNMAFVGLSDSWEQVDQATHRVYRFGQQYPVNSYIIVSENEGAVVANQERKGRQAEVMMDELLQHASIDALQASMREEQDYEEDCYRGHDFTWWLGDSYNTVEQDLADDSVDLWVTSIPFSGDGMYTYSNSPHDVGNNRSMAELLDHLKHIMARVLTKTKPGRNCCIHLTQHPTTLNNEGYVGILDFRGETIKAMRDVGWVFYGEVVIDKDPQVKAVRTHEVGLAFKTGAMDASKLRPALGDYVIIFKKPGGNEDPISAVNVPRYNGANGWITVEQWIAWAHPIWTGIRETDVLKPPPKEKDRKHICPLQLEVIERLIKLYSAPGELVADPFGGIASTLYEALRLNRRAWGSELKRSYWQTGKQNINRAQVVRQQTNMFDLLPVAEEVAV